MVRDFTKWDDSPVSLPHFAESYGARLQAGHDAAGEPVAIVVDTTAGKPVPSTFDRRIPQLPSISYPVADPNVLKKLAGMLSNAEQPLLVSSRAARTPAGYKGMLELAELIQAQVIDQHFRLNFPNTHARRIRSRPSVTNADVIVGLEVQDFWAVLHQMGRERNSNPRKITKAGAKIVSINAIDLFTKSVYQNFQRFQDSDMAIAADPEASLPFLIEEIKRQMTPERKRVIDERGKKYACRVPESTGRGRLAASYGWNSSPISTARMAMEVYAQIKDLDWSSVGGDRQFSSWPTRLWPMDKHYHHVGGPGGYGVGFDAPAAVGAALADSQEETFSVNLRPDGDLMFSPGVLWTAARSKIPLLSVMHNNRGYHPGSHACAAHVEPAQPRRL